MERSEKLHGQKRWRDSHPKERKVYQANWRATHKQHRHDYAKRIGQENKATVVAHYGGKCSCCGETRIEFLTINHINDNGKAQPLSYRKILYFHLIKEGFPEGYEVMCWNCNEARAHYGYCPHKTPIYPQRRG